MDLYVAGREQFLAARHELLLRRSFRFHVRLIWMWDTKWRRTSLELVFCCREIGVRLTGRGLYAGHSPIRAFSPNQREKHKKDFGICRARNGKNEPRYLLGGVPVLCASESGNRMPHSKTQSELWRVLAGGWFVSSKGFGAEASS